MAAISDKTNETRVVNVKVAHIRPKYNNLAEWMADPNNVYIGRRGIVFIDKVRFPKENSAFANPFKIKKGSEEGISRPVTVRLSPSQRHVSGSEEGISRPPGQRHVSGSEEGKSRHDVIDLYRAWIQDKLATEPGFADKLEALRGKTLGCWCKPERCHGDVIVELLKEKRYGQASQTMSTLPVKPKDESSDDELVKSTPTKLPRSKRVSDVKLLPKPKAK